MQFLTKSVSIISNQIGHRLYMASVDPATGSLSYDNDFRDENSGALGIDFNRKDWPGHPNGGFYKPHSMLFVTPSG